MNSIFKYFPPHILQCCTLREDSKVSTDVLVTRTLPHAKDFTSYNGLYLTVGCKAYYNTARMNIHPLIIHLLFLLIS